MPILTGSRTEAPTGEFTPVPALASPGIDASVPGRASEADASVRLSRGRLVSRGALLVAVTSTAFDVLADRQVANQWHIAGVAVACAAYVVMLAGERRWGGLTIGFVVAATLAPIVVGLGVVPRNGSLWSYAMYGRILGIHHLSPWTHAPTAFPNDPFRALVGRAWAGTPSVYGPVFTAVSGAAAALLGAATLPTRLFYQGLAALALAGAGLLVWRRTRSAAAVAFLVVHPLVVLYIVNAGRNDILVGVALLAAVLLAIRGRHGAAGAVGALGALVKITGVVGVVALVVTTAFRTGRRPAGRMALVAAGVLGLGYAAAGPAALFAPMRTAGGMYSRGSPWSSLTFLGIAKPGAHVALAVLGVLVLVVVARHARSAPGTAVTASLGMLALGASYTLAGYAAWGLPAAALDHRSRVSRIIAATGLVLVMTYEILRHPFAGPNGSALHVVAAVGGPLLMLLLVIALVRTGARPRREDAMTVQQASDPSVVPRAALRTLVVLPTLDEAANIRIVLARIRSALPAADVLVVDDGSTDGTPDLAEAVADELGHIRVLRRDGPRGLGPAYRAGFGVGLSDSYDVLVEMDADLSHDPRDLPALVAAVQSGADLVIGSRYVPGGGTPGWPRRRRFLSRAGCWYARSLLGLRVRDVTSGYRAYRASLLLVLGLETMTTTGYGFQIDMTDRARRAGGTIRELPIVFRDRTAGESKMSGAIIREALLMVTRRALRHRLRRNAHLPNPRPVPCGTSLPPIELVRIPSEACIQS